MVKYLYPCKVSCVQLVTEAVVWVQPDVKSTQDTVRQLSYPFGWLIPKCHEVQFVLKTFCTDTCRKVGTTGR